MGPCCHFSRGAVPVEPSSTGEAFGVVSSDAGRDQRAADTPRLGSPSQVISEDLGPNDVELESCEAAGEAGAGVRVGAPIALTAEALLAQIAVAEYANGEPLYLQKSANTFTRSRYHRS